MDLVRLSIPNTKWVCDLDCWPPDGRTNGQWSCRHHRHGAVWPLSKQVMYVWTDGRSVGQSNCRFAGLSIDHTNTCLNYFLTIKYSQTSLTKTDSSIRKHKASTVMGKHQRRHQPHWVNWMNDSGYGYECYGGRTDRQTVTRLLDLRVLVCFEVFLYYLEWEFNMFTHKIYTQSPNSKYSAGICSGPVHALSCRLRQTN